MGQKSSRIQNPVNYNCPKCKETGKLPNLAGRFFIVNLNECKCNGCDTIFPKSRFYKTIITNAKLYKNYI